DYWAPNHRWYQAARARLDRRPEAFRRVYDTGDFVVYRVEPPALLPPRDRFQQRRPFVGPWEGSPAGQPPVRSGDAGLPMLAGLTLDRRAAAPGDTVRGVIEWLAGQPQPAGSYSVAV